MYLQIEEIGPNYSGMAQRKRIGPITQGSVDRNYLPLVTRFFRGPLVFQFCRWSGTKLAKLLQHVKDI